MTIVVVDGHDLVGMYLTDAVVAEIEVGAPELVVRLQRVGRVAGSLSEFYPERVALKGEYFGGTQVA